MKPAIVIPARMGSSRFPGKPLELLRGANGSAASLIERCYRAARETDIETVIIATDHIDIYDHAKSFGAAVMMSPQSARNGTERCASLLDEIDADVIINFQGDAPLIPADFVHALTNAMTQNPSIEVATPVMPATGAVLENLRADRANGQVGGTTATFSPLGRALYFSKEIIPFSDHLEPSETVHLHVGLYAYRRSALAKYLQWPIGRLESIEGLEQLRFLENDCQIHCAIVDAAGRAFWEVNNPDDIPRVEAALTERGLE